MTDKRGLHLLTVVGARPQFVKAAMVSRAIAHLQPTVPGRHGRGRDPAHGPALRPDDEPGFLRRDGNSPAGRESSASARAADTARPRPPCWRASSRKSSPASPTASWSTATPTRRWPGRWPRPSSMFRSSTRKRACGPATATCPRKSTACWSITWPACCSAPSQQARENLAREGITAGVHVVGDVMYDAVLHFRIKAIPPPVAGPFGLCTLHRAENTDDPRRLRDIFAPWQNAPLPVLLPLHPRTRKTMEREGIVPGGRVTLLEPVSYFAMLGYLERCCFVVTDSGGVQKEAYFLGKRCITVRDETEWTELVACGANRLAGAETPAIRNAFAWVDGASRSRDAASTAAATRAGKSSTSLCGRWSAATGPGGCRDRERPPTRSSSPSIIARKFPAACRGS